MAKGVYIKSEVVSAADFNEIIRKSFEYKVLHVVRCTRCNQTGKLQRQLTWFQKLKGEQDFNWCGCEFDDETGAWFRVGWVSLQDVFIKESEK